MTIMSNDSRIKPTRPLGSSARGGFVRFMKRLDNLKGKELKNDATDLLLAQERLDFLT